VSGGWQAFREASRTKATVETAAGELERPAVSHRISTAADGDKPLEVHETTPDIVPVLPGEAEGPAPEAGKEESVTPESETSENDTPDSGSTDKGPDDLTAEDQDPDKLFQQAMDMMPAWTSPAIGMSRRSCRWRPLPACSRSGPG
jgi:hypothetical protein